MDNSGFHLRRTNYKCVFLICGLLRSFVFILLWTSLTKPVPFDQVEVEARAVCDPSVAASPSDKAWQSLQTVRMPVADSL